MKRRFRDLSAAEVLALAISLEEEDSGIYQEFARVLRPNFPMLASKLDAMRAEEDGHRHRLIESFRRKYGPEIPRIQRYDVRGFAQRPSPYSFRPLTPHEVRKRVDTMELETERFYTRTASQVNDAELRQLLGDLASEERRHEALAAELAPRISPPANKRPKTAAAQTAVRVAGGSARFGRADGRLGIDLGAAVCRGVRDPGYVGNIPGRFGGLVQEPGSAWDSPRP